MVLGNPLPATPEHETTSSAKPSEVFPPPINPNTLQARHSEGDINARRLSPAWHRTNSEISLTSVENEADGESLRRCVFAIFVSLYDKCWQNVFHARFLVREALGSNPEPVSQISQP